MHPAIIKLKTYIDDNWLYKPDVAKELNVTRQSLRLWLKGQVAPTHKNILRVEEWLVNKKEKVNGK